MITFTLLGVKKAHGDVALLWKYSINDFILTNIQSDCIVGIKCEITRCGPLFILGVYLPSTNHTTEEFQENFDLVWALYESHHLKVVTGDLNGDFGNVLGDKGRKLPNDRGKILLDFSNTLNICPVNLLDLCERPLKSYDSHLGGIVLLSITSFAKLLIREISVS